jgi:hypothetical protein
MKLWHRSRSCLISLWSRVDGFACAKSDRSRSEWHLLAFPVWVVSIRISDFLGKNNTMPQSAEFRLQIVDRLLGTRQDCCCGTLAEVIFLTIFADIGGYIFEDNDAVIPF